jgi:hypothetical protein
MKLGLWECSMWNHGCYDIKPDSNFKPDSLIRLPLLAPRFRGDKVTPAKAGARKQGDIQ